MKYTNNNLFNNHITNIIEYLSDYIDVTEIEKRYLNCDYNIINNMNHKIKVNGNLKEFNWENILGTSITIYYFDGNRYVVDRSQCYIQKYNIAEENINHIIFHELMHVGSTKVILEGERRIRIFSGIDEFKEIRIFEKIENSNNAKLLNEALTELVAKVIYDDIYNDSYPIVKKTNTSFYKSSYRKPYFILCMLLLNYFEKNKDELFEIYFNNNIDLLNEILNFRKNVDLRELINTTNTFKDIKKITKEYDNIIAILDSREKLLNEDVRYQYNLLRSIEHF